VHAIEQPEGGWVNSWVIYATIFALESLSLGETYETSDSARRACDFLVGKRMENGRYATFWETYETEIFGTDMRGLRMDHTQVVQTSWAVMAAKYPQPKPIA
jgi:lanosterol synthase